MNRKIDIDNWERRDHFHFFRQFEYPFFGICTEVDCTETYHQVKEEGASFFLSYLHKSLVAANQTEPFRYRIVGDEVLVYDQTDASPTINRPNGTFGFSYLHYYPDFSDFVREAQREIEKVRNSSGLVSAVSGENVIHYSSLP